MNDASSPPCPACGFAGDTLEPGSCGRCGVVFTRFHARTTDLLAMAPPPKVSTGTLVVEEPHPGNLWALPAAFGLSVLMNLTTFGRLIQYSSAGNWAHELGHACWRWLNGRSALPLLFITLQFGPDRSVVTSLAVVGGLVVLFLWANPEECRGLQTLAVVFIVLFLAFALCIPAPTEHFLEWFAGLFGQFWIGTLWVVLFYFRFPSIVSWNNLRYAFLFLGAMSVTFITGVFLRSRHDMSLLPWGAFFGGDGDLDRLLDGGWLVPEIRRVYFTIAGLSFAVIVGCYAYFAQRELTTRA